VLVVSHGGIIRATRRLLGGADEHIGNLGGSWFEVDADGGTAVGEVVVLREQRDRMSFENAAREVL
jgi:broad specificity phosphatase PhoE